jgi:hypothetical protein
LESASSSVTRMATEGAKATQSGVEAEVLGAAVPRRNGAGWGWGRWGGTAGMWLKLEKFLATSFFFGQVLRNDLFWQILWNDASRRPCLSILWADLGE